MFTALLLATTILTPVVDPPTADPKTDALIHSVLVAETARLDVKFLDGATTKAAWDKKRPVLKEQFLDMLGLSPLPEKTPLKATVTGTVEQGDIVIEKVHFQSLPGLYVTGNLYKPRHGPERALPAILYVCGHSNLGRDGNKAGYQRHGVWFANNGYVCLVIDTLQLGEVAGKHHGTHNLGRFWWHSRGYTPAGVECWNGVRAIDYLCSRPDVDANRIGVTGRSGGGATTVWIAVADDRVKVAAPVSGFSDLESHVAHKVINGHCDCMFPINTYQWEFTTMLAMIAPRPLMFANSDADPIFPMDGNRRIIAKLRQCYEMLGVKDRLEEVVTTGKHEDTPELRTPVFRFFNQHLRNKPAPVLDGEFTKIDAKTLRVFPEDSDLPKDSINDRVDQLFVPKADVKLPTNPDDFGNWKDGLLTQLKERSFRAIATSPPLSETKLLCEVDDLGSLVKYSYPVVVVLNPTEDSAAAKVYWCRKLAIEPSGIFTLRPRGGGSKQWTVKNPPNTVERSYALLGQTVDTGRVQDVIAVVGQVETKGPSVWLVGRGPAGVIAAYSALLAPDKIHQVLIADPPTSHTDGPHFLNVMRTLDIPDALGLLAPKTPLKLIGTTDKAFDKTAAIYKLAGAEKNFNRE